MHAVIAGGNGQTGSLVIDNLVKQGHTVTALVRNPSSVPNRNGVEVVQGTPSNISDVKRAFLESPSQKKPDVVIITLSHPKGVTFENGAGLLTHVARNVVSVARDNDLSVKIIYMSAFGVGNSFPGLNFLMRGIVTVTPMKEQFDDHAAAENTLKNANTGVAGRNQIKFVVVRPVMLTNGKEANVESLGEKAEKASFMPSISRASVAKFMVEAAQSQERDGQVLVIANAK